jgi:N-acetylglutamate synthase-like GNAT family acetyltransferase
MNLRASQIPPHMFNPGLSSPERGRNAPSRYTIRPGEATDQDAIRSLIHSVGINPLGLDWRRFIVATDPEDHVIGCGQIKLHRDGSRELASIAVRESWRELGIATNIIKCLLREERGAVWLMCRSEMVPFYERVGFYEVLRIQDLPPYFQRIIRLWRLLSKVSRGQHLGSVMAWKNRSRKFLS